MSGIEEKQYASRKSVYKSYRPNNHLMSPGLQRARAPYRTKNAITGTIIALFGIGVWAYSISAVKQDVFDDVDEEARLLQAGLQTQNNGSAAAAAAATGSITTASAAAAGTSDSAVIPSAPQTPAATAAVAASSAPASGQTQIRGVLARNLYSYAPSLFDPKSKTLVWGAPPVDKIGRMSDPTNRT